ncbi:MAG: excinuclease ABC subunit C [Bacteroidales bacterium 45-6]|nr:MAG: excinuclease ABC subunit C [Bacteroidales bacterium 45-6]
MSDFLKNIIKNIPEKPGCYQYFDEKGSIIYVGKAKNLKKRVSSYFTKTHDDSPKTRVLVSKIKDIRYIVVDTEEDTFLLENNLIKQFKPRYNIMLKDDKTYPSIVIKNEYFPRIFQTRKIYKDGSLYFGPYTSVVAIRAMMEIVHKLYPIRTCKLNLSPEQIAKGKYKVCLEYHIKRCKGPCEGFQGVEEYNKNIAQIKEILKGNIGDIIKKIYQEMQEKAAELKFEEAQLLKEKYTLIDNFRTKSTVVSQITYNIDVFSYDEDKQAAYINYLHVVNGAINQAFTFEYKRILNEEKEYTLGLGIVEMRSRFGSKSQEVIVPFIPDLSLNNVIFTIPQRGDKRKLLELSEQNVKQYKVDKLKKAEALNPEQRSIRILKEIQASLGMQKMPLHIECFDNSNIQGSSPVAACVVFKKGKPSKQEYRKYHIKTVVGPDDYASMQEVVFRRYTRMIEEETPLPDLIITDGGKGQMESVRQIIQDQLHLDIPIAGLAKDNKHKTAEILFGFPPKEVGIKQNTAIFHLLEQIQNEVHRFAITFHKQVRSKAQIRSEFDQMNGIGEATQKKLLNYFRSIKRLKSADIKEIESLVGEKKAKIISDYFAQHNVANEKGRSFGQKI